VRTELERPGVRLESKLLNVTTVGAHEFNAVAVDGSIIASIKSHSGKTTRGRRPAAKCHACLTELHSLSPAKAHRILVLTTPERHTLFIRYIEVRRDPDTEIELLAYRRSCRRTWTIYKRSREQRSVADLACLRTLFDKVICNASYRLHPRWVVRCENQIVKDTVGPIPHWYGVRRARESAVGFEVLFKRCHESLVGYFYLQVVKQERVVSKVLPSGVAPEEC